MSETPTPTPTPTLTSAPTPAPQPKPAPFHKRHKRALLIAFVLTLIVLALAALLFKTEALAALHWLGQFFRTLVDAVKNAGPLPFFAAYAILPAFGVPISLFNLTVDPTFGPQIGLGWVIALSALAMALNLALSYWLARYALRPLIEKLVARLGYTLPVIPRDEHITASILLRVVPGAPYVVQSFILGLAKVRFLPYMIVSFLGQFGWALAIILVTHGGKTALEGGSFKIVFVAIVLIILLVIGTRLVRKYYTKKTALKKAAANPAPAEPPPPPNA